MGIFGRLFNKKTTTDTPVDLSVLGIDIHSHFIPGIDDGAKTIDDTVRMLRTMHELGYRKVITTPHVMSDFYRNSSETILSGLENVRAALREEGIPLQVEAAAEYYLDFDLERKLNEEKLLTFGKNYLLFEVSYMNPPDNLERMMFLMQTLGYKPVLAHPERYNYWHTNFEKYEEIKERGVLLQMNVNSLTGYYSPSTKKISEMMIDKGMIDLLGTDCHHSGHLELLKKCRYEKYLHKLIESGKLLNSTL
jgi:tyrosine-protein phosphatase YwqE